MKLDELKKMKTLKDKLRIAYDDLPEGEGLYNYYDENDVNNTILDFLELLKSSSFCECGYESECFLCRKYKEIFGNFER